MNNQHLHLVGAAGPRVDGIDVAQLLRDLGEASAASSAVDLFGLLLAAQQVLVRVHAGSMAANTADETALLAAYRMLKDVHRGDLLGMAQILAQDHPRARPVLALVQGRNT